MLLKLHNEAWHEFPEYKKFYSQKGDGLLFRRGKVKPLGDYVASFDNGSTGYLTVLDNTGKIAMHRANPSIKCRDYTKREKYLKRLDLEQFAGLLKLYQAEAGNKHCCLRVVLEQPFSQRGMAMAVIAGQRYYEAMVIVLELLDIPFLTVNSKTWQKWFGFERSDKIAFTKRAKENHAGESWESNIVEGDSVLMADWYLARLRGEA